MLTDKLTSIADAIREKGGTTEKLTLDAMPTAIAALSTGGGGGEDLVPNPIVYDGTCSYLFAQGQNDWILDNYYDRVKIQDVRSMDYAFYYSNAKKVPSIKQFSTSQSWNYTFSSCNVEEIGDIYDFYPSRHQYMFGGCSKLRHCPNFINPKSLNDGGYDLNNYMFSNCSSLRDVSVDLMKSINTNTTQAGYHPYGYMFSQCYALDEINCLNPTDLKTYTTNFFNSTFKYCHHLKRITFNTNEDGTPKTVKWKNQTIDLSQYVGWAGAANADKNITTKYNSGITTDKEVVSKDDYERLKDDPDWWSRDFAFSRFGHNAAVELFNSLPDASAYLETSSGTNTIKFYTNAGMSIDGGGVNALTEEEIAVAAAKGWTISYTT